ncbi:MAG: hypothetical protein HYX89_04235 [Chloroflexi bacterium]|nr:hypothetical protein [Chloroflexota bacterium]
MSSQYEREIEELLRRLEGAGKPRKPRRRGWGSRLLDALRPHSPGQLMLTSFALLLLGLVLTYVAPIIGRPLITLSVTLFFVAYFTSFIRPGGYERRWRGQRIELPGDAGKFGEQLYRWLYGGPKTHE